MSHNIKFGMAPIECDYGDLSCLGGFSSTLGPHDVLGLSYNTNWGFNVPSPFTPYLTDNPPQITMSQPAEPIQNCLFMKNGQCAENPNYYPTGDPIPTGVMTNGGSNTPVYHGLEGLIEAAKANPIATAAIGLGLFFILTRGGK